MAGPEVRDLLVAPTYAGTSWGTLDLATDPRDPVPGEREVDLDVAVGPDALRQALLIRLLTPLGSLAPLGHVAFGSRLHELIGELDTPTTRRLARSYALQAVTAEPRVEAVLDLRVATRAEDGPETVSVWVLVKAADIADPIELGIEVAL